MNKFYKALASLIKKKKKKTTQILNRNERRDNNGDPTNITRILKGYYDNFMLINFIILMKWTFKEDISRLYFTKLV